MTETLRPALEPPLAALSLVLDDVSVTPAGRRRVVRVVVDRDLSHLEAADTTSPVAPLTLDEVAQATRVVSDRLDEDDLMGSQPYTLEVSSPGVDRSLRGHRRFRRNVGRLVAVVLESGDVFTARLISVSAEGVELEMPAEPKQPSVRRQVLLDEITSAKVVVEFNPPPGTEPSDEAPDDGMDPDETDDDTDQADDDTDQTDDDTDQTDDEERPHGH